MEILSGLESLRKLPAKAALSVGNYDGVHLGHQEIIRTMRALIGTASPEASPRAEEKPWRAARDTKPDHGFTSAPPRSAFGEAVPLAEHPVVVVTFEPHPLSVLRPDLSPPRLTPAPMKRELLHQAGVTHLVELEPTPEVLNVTAEDFWARLRDEARPAHVVEGPDFNFGKGARGNVTLLREWTESSGVNFTVVEPFEITLPGLHVVPVSSSLIRWLIANGRVRDAAAGLGRPYTLRGTVVEGYRRGAGLGFPTANLDIGDQLIPADGIYAGRTAVNGDVYRAAVSIGSAPTFEGARRQVEAYLLDFSGNLYGRTLDLELTHWVRDQMRFPSVERLVERIKLDVEVVGLRV